MATVFDRLGARLLQNPRFARAPIAAYCLEVVGRPTPDTLVVASGFGERAQWYRNLQAHPGCSGTSGNIPGPGTGCAG